MSLLLEDDREMPRGFVRVRRVSCSPVLHPRTAAVALSQPATGCSAASSRRCCRRAVRVLLTPACFPVMLHEMTDLQV